MDRQFVEDYRRYQHVIDRCIPKEVTARLLGKQDEALKAKYNRLLKVEREIADKLDSGDLLRFQQDDLLNQHKQVISELGQVLKDLEKLGVEVSDLQIENGF